jgi:hypothetical protein
MTNDMEHPPEPEPELGERLVGVYRDDATARRAAETARSAGGERVEIGAEDDRIAALRGEMRQEMGDAWAGPSVGIYTKEMARSVTKWTAAGIGIGVLLLLPVAFFAFEDLSLVARLFAAACTGAFGGGAIGFLFGGGFFEVRRKARDELAAEQGVVVGADVSGPGVAQAMAEPEPIRLDRVRPTGQPEDTVVTEDQETKDEVDLTEEQARRSPN